MLRVLGLLLLSVVPAIFAFAKIPQKNVTVTGRLYCDTTFVAESRRFFDVQLVQNLRVLASKRVQDWHSFEITGNYIARLTMSPTFVPPVLRVDGDCYGSKSKYFSLVPLPRISGGHVDLGLVVLNNRS